MTQLHPVRLVLATEPRSLIKGNILRRPCTKDEVQRVFSFGQNGVHFNSDEQHSQKQKNNSGIEQATDLQFAWIWNSIFIFFAWWSMPEGEIIICQVTADRIWNIDLSTGSNQHKTLYKLWQRKEGRFTSWSVAWEQRNTTLKGICPWRINVVCLHIQYCRHE